MAELSLRSAGLNPRSVDVEHAMGKVAVTKVFSGSFGFPLAVIPPLSHIQLFIYHRQYVRPATYIVFNAVKRRLYYVYKRKTGYR
jgi:hypothetical protein